jgi:hypothetical protein
MAIIITSHMTVNEKPASTRPWPGIRIQAIDIVQPPGIGMPPDIDRHMATVAALDPANARTTAAMNSASRLIGRLGSG